MLGHWGTGDQLLMKSRSALIIFAREPKDGKVKTRLCRDLPSATVTRLYKAFVNDVLAVARKTRCDQRFIYYVGNGSSIPFLKRAKSQFQLRRQTGKDLGERMYRAFHYCQKKHFGRIVIIGTDCLTLTSRDIETALKKLKSTDCVLGPSKDGGYYLIALNAPHRKLFEGIDWSTASVLKQTLRRARRLGKRTYLLKGQEDIDTAVHLKKFVQRKKSPSLAPHTQKVLQNLSLFN